MSLSISMIPEKPIFGTFSHAIDCLENALDARLLADPRVIDFHQNAGAVALLRSSNAPDGSVTRTVRLRERILQVVAIPECISETPKLGRELRRHSSRRDVLVIPERRLRRRPEIDGSQLIAANAGYPASPLDRILLAQFLADQGGSGYLIDCAARMGTSEDPVRALLAAAAAKAIAIDISQPIGPLSRICLLQPG